MYTTSMSLDPLTSILICPQNDVESATIVAIAQALRIPCVLSKQPHGATLDLEPHLVERIRHTNPIAHDVVIVEMPSESAEDKLRELGFDVHVVDHHRYEHLDRMRMESSLEQFRALFAVDDATLVAAGFDPVLIAGVGMIDRGFVWELTKMHVGEEDRKRIIAYYRAQSTTLDPDRAKEEKEAKRAWEHREMLEGVLVVRSERKELSIRDAISFIVAEHFDTPPVVLIYQPGRIVYVQDTTTARALQRTFGGFTFGQDLCWGRAVDAHGSIPDVHEVLAAHGLALLAS